MDLNLSSANSSRLVFFEQIGSTNQFLLDSAYDLQQWPDGSVVCAAEQTSGVGRNNRSWQSPAGESLSLSILIRKPSGASHWYGMLLAMALTRSLVEQGADAGLKWPNDVLVGERKISGLLGQAAADYLVVGLGLNLHSVAVEGSTSISEIGLDPDFDMQMAAILKEFSKLRAQYELSGLAAILDELRAISLTLGKRVRVTIEDGIIEGFATEIDEQGRLVLNDGEHVISAGDIFHLRGVESN